MNCIFDKPVQSSDGSVWHQLHSEREEVCESLLKASTFDLQSPTREWHEQLLQRRLQKIDRALDRLMTGPFGNCNNCGRAVDESKLALDAAIEFCVDCWEKIQIKDAIDRVNNTDRFDKLASETFTESIGQTLTEGIALQTLAPLDTVLVSTRFSDYRIFLLDPKTRRALVQGGKHFVEPVEAVINGSVLNGLTFRVGWIGIGMRLEFVTNGSVTSTSPVQSFRVETHAPNKCGADANASCAS